MKKYLIEMINNKKIWGKIKYPENLSNDIMIKIYNKKINNYYKYKYFLLIQFFRKYSLYLIVIIILFNILFINNFKKYNIMITYPYNGERKVEIIGSFNDFNEKLEMKLNKDKNRWERKIYLKNKNYFEYQFIINENLYFSENNQLYFETEDGIKKNIKIIL